MSGAAAIIIATEEEEAESAALRACVEQYGDTLDRPTDADLALLAVDVDELKAKLITMRQRIESAQS